MFRLGDVALHRHGPAAEFPDFARRLFHRGDVAARQHHIRPGFGQRDRHGPAHAAGGPGHQGNPSGEIKQGGKGHQAPFSRSFAALAHSLRTVT